MEVAGKSVVITGSGSGIGAAMAAQFVATGARVMVSDRDVVAMERVVSELGCAGFACDVGQEGEIIALMDAAEEAFGHVDVCVSNAGLGRGQPDHAASASDADWDVNWRVHVMAHVWAARRLLPGMIARGSGYFVNVASAAGLLNQVGDAAYSATKHAAVSFAESLAITHGADGIGVSVVCPQYVATPLIGLKSEDAKDQASLLTADQVASCVLDGLADDKFLIMTHPEAAKFAAFRGSDHDHWIAGMQKFQAVAKSTLGEVTPSLMYKLM